VVVENIRELVKKLDMPTKQVAIDAMIVDVNLQDGAETGVDWLINSVQEQSRRQAALGTDENGEPIGRAIGSLQELGLATALAGNPAAGVLNFGILTGDIDWQGIIQAEIRNQKGRLISNPVLVTIENEPATIDITQEIPFVEVKETNAGGSQTNTEFKNIGTVLTVTPRVTHDDDILVDINAKESTTAGEFNGIPIEDKRMIETNLRVKSGNTIFIGGLRKQSRNNTVRKIPVLGDIPVLNVLFRQNSRTERVNELLIFLACNVVQDKTELTPYQKERLTQVKEVEVHVDAQGALFHDMVYPAQETDPLWKWRRSN
jgi:type II secretory pathway component GspD/PulD (secretin)